MICTFPRILELNHSNCSRQLFGHTNGTFEQVFNFRETRKYKGNEKNSRSLFPRNLCPQISGINFDTSRFD